MNKKSGLKDNLEKTRNTAEQMTWYDDLERFAEDAPWSTIDKVNYFPSFSSRQSITRFIETYEFYNLIRDVPGSIIECGVAAGSFLMGMAHFCAIFEGIHYVRKVVGFDTFEGFVEVNKEDKTSGAEHVKKGGLHWDSYQVLQP